MLQAQVGGGRGTSSLQLPRLQPRQGQDPKEKVAENAQGCIGKGVYFHPHHPWTVLCGGTAQQHTATAAALSIPTCTGLPCHSGRNECPASLEAQPTSTKSVSSDSECKHFVSEWHVQSSRNSISAGHDRAQWGLVRKQNSGHHKNFIKTYEAKDKWLCRMLTDNIVNIDDMYCWLWPQQMTDLSSCQRGRPILTKLQLSNSNKNLVLSPRRGLTPRLADWSLVVMWLWLWVGPEVWRLP
jgi:hypothetical protein